MTERTRVRNAPLTVEEARQELDRVHRLYSEKSDIAAKPHPSLGPDQVKHFADAALGYREDCQLALAFFQEATRAREAATNEELARSNLALAQADHTVANTNVNLAKSVRLWAIVAGTATAIQAITAIVTAISGAK